MADVAGKLSEVDMLLLYQAKAVEEYLDPRTDGKIDWESVFTRAGVHEITAEEAKAWAKWNFVHNRVGSAETWRTWLENQGDRDGSLKWFLNTAPYGQSIEGWRSYEGERAGHFLIAGYFTGMTKADYTAAMHERWDLSAWVQVNVRNNFERTLDDDVYWQNAVEEYQFAKGRKVMGDLIEVVKNLKLDRFTHCCNKYMKGFPDDDRYCAVFIFYNVLRKYKVIRFGTTNDHDYRSLLDRVIIKAMTRGVLTSRRTADGWAKWWVDELFHNPGGANYFHVNPRNFTRIQYEVLRQGRSCNWWGVLRLQKLNNLVTNGWSWSMGIKRCLPSLYGMK